MANKAFGVRLEMADDPEGQGRAFIGVYYLLMRPDGSFPHLSESETPSQIVGYAEVAFDSTSVSIRNAAEVDLVENQAPNLGVEAEELTGLTFAYLDD